MNVEIYLVRNSCWGGVFNFSPETRNSRSTIWMVYVCLFMLVCVCVFICDALLFFCFSFFLFSVYTISLCFSSMDSGYSNVHRIVCSGHCIDGKYGMSINDDCNTMIERTNAEEKRDRANNAKRTITHIDR